MFLSLSLIWYYFLYEKETFGTWHFINAHFKIPAIAQIQFIPQN